MKPELIGCASNSTLDSVDKMPHFDYEPNKLEKEGLHIPTPPPNYPKPTSTRYLSS